MLADEGKPLVEASRRGLGVVMPGGDGEPDVIPDAEGLVGPGSVGMSVVPAWRHLPRYRIPKRLQSLHPAARGKDNLRIWRMGEGPFESGPFTEQLLVRLDNPHHGLVEPASRVSPEQFQAALAATQDQWVLDEE
jgi:hypothetical protein